MKLSTILEQDLVIELTDLDDFDEKLLNHITDNRAHTFTYGGKPISEMFHRFNRFAEQVSIHEDFRIDSSLIYATASKKLYAVSMAGRLTSSHQGYVVVYMVMTPNFVIVPVQESTQAENTRAWQQMIAKDRQAGPTIKVR